MLKENAKETLKEDVFNKWVLDLDSQLQEPMYNKDAFERLMSTAYKQGLPVIMLCVGCMNWKPSDEDGEFYIDKMNPDYIRLKRAAKRISSFQKSLSTFGVNSKCFINLSRTQPTIETSIGIDGKKVRIQGNETIDELADEAQDIFSKLIGDYGGSSECINDFEVISSVYKNINLSELQERITFSDEEISTESFDKGLYRAITTILPQHVRSILSNKGIVPAGILWVDLMSPAAGWHRDQLHESLAIGSPDIPAVIISKNSGKWWARGDSEKAFPTKLSILAEELKLKVPPSSVPTNRGILRKSGYKSLLCFLDRYHVPYDSIKKENKQALIDFIYEVSE
ncbi:hypothetical protein L4C34_09670 [Vibrio profundum]|uniref:hypothetical protein n=1 Tax=Vibrio profundum TaxID=2910247 RepID=UPI003D0D7B96